MSGTLTAAQAPSARWRRPAVVIGAVVAALLVWLVEHEAAGVHVQSPVFGSHNPQAINAGFVIVVSAVAALLGWAAVALIERASGKPRRNWIILGVVVLLISLSAPLSGSRASGTDRLSLVLLHLTVAAVLIPGLALTARGRVAAPPGASATVRSPQDTARRQA